MAQWIPVRADELMRGDTVKRTWKGKKFLLTTVERRETPRGNRVHLRSDLWFVDAYPGSTWWRQL